MKKNDLRDLIEKHPRSYFRSIKRKKYQEIWKKIVNETRYLDKFYNANDISRLFYFLEDLHDIIRCKNPRCSNFGKPIVKKITNFDQLKHLHCNNKCAQTSLDIIEKCKQTRKRNGTSQHGVIVKSCDKIKKKYGTKFYVQSEDFKRKAKLTMKNNGYLHPMKSEMIKQQMKNRYFKKFGVSHLFQNHNLYCKFHKKYVYNGICFDSFIEIAFYVYCCNRGHKVIVHPCSFDYEFEGKTHKYIPDFLVDNQLIEIKGNNF